MQTEIKILHMSAEEFASSPFSDIRHEGVGAILLLGGDRWLCIDEVIVATTIDGTFAGIATLSPRGEDDSGHPTIVALYVPKAQRGQRVGSKLQEAAIDRMVERGLVPVRIDTLNSKVLRIIQRLPAEKQSKLIVVDQSMGGTMDFVLEK